MSSPQMTRMFDFFGISFTSSGIASLPYRVKFSL
jgi:hypothetical protein